jgi:hypothetical protein
MTGVNYGQKLERVIVKNFSAVIYTHIIAPIQSSIMPKKFYEIGPLKDFFLIGDEIFYSELFFAKMPVV